MKSWTVQNAKAHFSELLDVCLTNEPQVVTRREIETVVVVAIEEWIRLDAINRPSIKSLLLSEEGNELLNTPVRYSAKRRDIPKS